MKNSIPSTLYVAKDLFNRIGGAMRNGSKHNNATNYASIKNRVEQQIDDYDAAVAVRPITLEKINPLWSTKCDEGKTAHDMYDSQTSLIQNIKNDLMRINGGGKKYRCPLCEVNDVYHMDHYIPREKMPEFSVHPLNLIYICHDCNEIKGTKWLDAAGQRMIFNAYFDSLSGIEVLVCEVNIIINGMPWADIKENTTVHHTIDSQRELSTYKELGIDKVYESKVNDYLQAQCKLAKGQVDQMKADGKTIDEAWQFLRESYQKMLGEQIDVISRFTFQGMSNSTVLKDWLDMV